MYTFANKAQAREAAALAIIDDVPVRVIKAKQTKHDRRRVRMQRLLEKQLSLS